MTTSQNFGVASNLAYDFGTAGGTVQLTCQTSTGNALAFSVRISAVKVGDLTNS